MIAGCILGCIIIAMYKYASNREHNLEDAIVILSDFLHKGLVTYGVINNNYAFALFTTVVAYIFAVAMGLFIGYMQREKRWP